MLLVNGMAALPQKFKVEEKNADTRHVARNVTGLSILASRESMYFETGWESEYGQNTGDCLSNCNRVHFMIVIKSCILFIFHYQHHYHNPTVHILHVRMLH